MNFKTLQKYLPNIILIPPLLLILYALPNCFTIPTTRISLPFTNNTAQATSIVLISTFFIFTFLRLKYTPFLWRVSTCIALSLIGFVFFEVIDTLNLLAFMENHPQVEQGTLFLYRNAMITICLLMVLWLINLYAGTIQVTSTICFGMLIFIFMTIYQIGRGWYNHPFDDHYTIVYKAVGIWMWGTLVKRNDK